MIKQTKKVAESKTADNFALSLFHDMAKRVPAYQLFLAEQGVDPERIKTIADFRQSVPSINKDNYLRSFTHKQLSWDGRYPEGSWTIASTSGSTGTPYYFPRQAEQDEQYATMAETYLRHNFHIDRKKTLYIVAFPMGAWIGGVFTYEALQRIMKKGLYDMSIITPGIHIAEIIAAIKQLANDFDQIIIGAYAPFLKDILDKGTQQGIVWQEVNVGFIFSAEAFNELFRDYVYKVVGASNILTMSLNHYGTVDLGTMAHETPLSILLRRTLFSEDCAQALLPPDARQPTICQYDPTQFYFEEVGDHELLCSARSGIPLVRYDLKDYGGVFTFDEMLQKTAAAGLDIAALIKKSGLEGYNRNPFVYVYERNDFSVGYFAFRLYPDTIRRAIFANGLHEAELTGKFTMESTFGDDGRQALLIHVELSERADEAIRTELSARLVRLFHDALITDSSEYRETHRLLGDAVKPLIVIHMNGDEAYFKVGTKQKWVIM